MICAAESILFLLEEMCQHRLMKNLILLLLGLFSFNAFGVGFEPGNSFEAVEIEGDIMITCDDMASGRHDFVSVRCRDELLLPGEFVKFSGDKGLDADEVSLTSKWEDGSTRTKTENYDPATGLSKSTFNLWIRTLFQRPLLDYGKNEITYELTKDGSAVQSGRFEAQVAQGEKRVCSARHHFFSNSSQDCYSPSNMCRRYFSLYGYCR